MFAGTPEKGIGIAYMVGTTGGYLVGFLVAVFFAGFVNLEKSVFRKLFANFICCKYYLLIWSALACLFERLGNRLYLRI